MLEASTRENEACRRPPIYCQESSGEADSQKPYSSARPCCQFSPQGHVLFSKIL